MNKKIALAVLPFANRSSDTSNEFFCDGLTEEIIHALAAIPQLRVISRTSSFFFKNHQATLTEIADKLQVSVVLEGSVRLAGNSLRISAQLVQVDGEVQFWTETWDRKLENVFEIQDEISLHIADKLREHLGHLDIADHLVVQPTPNTIAYQSLLQGRFHLNKWNPEDANLAIQHFEKALKLDESLLEAHLGLADGYSFLAVSGFAPREAAWQKSIKHIDSARKIQPNHAGLNYMLANQAFFTEASFGLAMHYALKAIEFKPNHAESHQFLSFLYILKGDAKKSWDHLVFALSMDPLNPETRFYKAYYAYRSGELSKASEILNQLLEQNPKNMPALIVQIYMELVQGNMDKADRLIKSIPPELLTPDERLGLNALLAALSGQENEADLELLKQNGVSPTAHHAHSYLFLTYVALGKFDEAFETLEKIFSLKSSVLLLAFSDPLAKPITSDIRYRAFHDRIYSSESQNNTVSKNTPALLDEQKAGRFRNELDLFMIQERPYLNPALTLRSLAGEIHLHPNQLSWLLNEEYGKNFNEFVNGFRVDHFKELAKDASNSHISLIGLAYESGFNSKTVFNTTFKKLTGLTPKEFQKGT